MLLVWNLTMTNKLKKKARSLSERAKVSYQGAVNILRQMEDSPDVKPLVDVSAWEKLLQEREDSGGCLCGPNEECSRCPSKDYVIQSQGGVTLELEMTFAQVAREIRKTLKNESNSVLLPSDDPLKGRLGYVVIDGLHSFLDISWSFSIFNLARGGYGVPEGLRPFFESGTGRAVLLKLITSGELFDFYYGLSHRDPPHRVVVDEVDKPCDYFNDVLWSMKDFFTNHPKCTLEAVSSFGHNRIGFLARDPDDGTLRGRWSSSVVTLRKEGVSKVHPWTVPTLERQEATEWLKDPVKLGTYLQALDSANAIEIAPEQPST